MPPTKSFTYSKALDHLQLVFPLMMPWAHEVRKVDKAAENLERRSSKQISGRAWQYEK